MQYKQLDMNSIHSKFSKIISSHKVIYEDEEQCRLDKEFVDEQIKSYSNLIKSDLFQLN